jgi:hypothetical protein
MPAREWTESTTNASGRRGKQCVPVINIINNDDEGGAEKFTLPYGVWFWEMIVMAWTRVK